MKSYAVSDSILGILDISGGLHRSDSDASGIPSINSNNSYAGYRELQNADVVAGYSLRFAFDKIVVSPRYGIIYKKYFYGPNEDREDFLQTANLKIDYIVNENMNISVFGFSRATSQHASTRPSRARVGRRTPCRLPSCSRGSASGSSSC
jgi:hypothetical protein